MYQVDVFTGPFPYFRAAAVAVAAEALDFASIRWKQRYEPALKKPRGRGPVLAARRSAAAVGSTSITITSTTIP